MLISIKLANFPCTCLDTLSYPDLLRVAGVNILEYVGLGSSITYNATLLIVLSQWRRLKSLVKTSLTQDSHLIMMGGCTSQRNTEVSFLLKYEPFLKEQSFQPRLLF
jgi:hypothetical protein